MKRNFKSDSYNTRLHVMLPRKQCLLVYMNTHGSYDFKALLTFCFVIKATLWLPVSCVANVEMLAATQGLEWVVDAR